MALAFLPTGSAQSHAVVERAIIADLGGLADNHAHAMVDEKTPADTRAGVDLDAGEPAREKRQKTCQPAQPALPQPMVHAMQKNRVEPRVAGHYFESVTRRRVALHYAANIFFELLPHSHIRSCRGRGSEKSRRPYRRGLPEPGRLPLCSGNHGCRASMRGPGQTQATAPEMEASEEIHHKACTLTYFVPFWYRFIVRSRSPNKPRNKSSSPASGRARLNSRRSRRIKTS